MVAIEEARPCHLLVLRPPAERADLARQMSTESLSLGDSIYESGAPLKQVFFPTSSVISLLYVRRDGSSEGVAVVA